jgi:hypothetical protein
LAYTAYRTWTTGEIVTAALMNEQVRDNGLLTAPAIMTTAGDIMYASAANTPARLAKSTSSTRVLTNTGTSNVPAWAQVTLTSGVTGTLPVANGGTNLTSLGSGVATFMGTPSSANLRGALTDETGSGAAVFATSPTLVTPALGTPSAGVLTNATGLPEAGLAVSNGPTNGYMLTAQSGASGGLTWAAAAAGVSVFYGEFTKNTADATGTTTVVSSVGFTVKAIIFFTGEHNVVGQASWGLATSVDQGALIDATAATAGRYYIPGVITPNQAIAWDQGSDDYYEGTVSTFGSDGFTMTWTKTGSTSGTQNVIYMAIG